MPFIKSLLHSTVFYKESHRVVVWHTYSYVRPRALWALTDIQGLYAFKIELRIMRESGTARECLAAGDCCSLQHPPRLRVFGATDLPMERRRKRAQATAAIRNELTFCSSASNAAAMDAHSFWKLEALSISHRLLCCATRCLERQQDTTTRHSILAQCSIAGVNY